MTKIRIEGGYFGHCGTGLNLKGTHDLSVKKTVFDNVGTVLNYNRRTTVGDSSREDKTQSKSGAKTSRSGWTPASEHNWRAAFGNKLEKIAMFNFEDVNMEKVGTFYRGPEGVQLTVRRGTLNAETVLEIVVPNTIIANGDYVKLSVPMPKEFDQNDIKSILETISQAIKKGENPELPLKNNQSWLQWIAAGADSVTLLQALIAFCRSSG